MPFRKGEERSVPYVVFSELKIKKQKECVILATLITMRSSKEGEQKSKLSYINLLNRVNLLYSTYYIINRVYYIL